MRKGALKKKQRQLEELHLDRREALGELVLGMYVQNNWDDDLLARGSAEVAEVETELNELIAGNEPEGPSATEKDFPVTGEHRLPTGEYTAEHAIPVTGEYTAEHAISPTGEHTAEHSLPASDEHDYPATGEYTAEHPLPQTGEHTAEHEAPPATDEEPKLSRAEKKAARKAEKERKRQEKEAAPAPAPASTPSATAPTPSATAPTPSATAPTPSASASVPAEPAARPSVTAPTRSATDPPASAGSTSAAVPAAQPSVAGKPPESPGETAAARKAIDVPPAPAPPEPEPTDPLDRLEKEITEREAKARTAIEAAKASSNADAKTELTAITRDVEAGKGALDEALQKAAAAITAANEKATQAEARLQRETAQNREAAAEWVKTQASEIEADAALAAEMSSEQDGSPQPVKPDPVLSARVTTLETELAAERASKEEALTKAAARLQEIEQSARLAEARVEAAENAATEARDQAMSKANAPASDGNAATEAEAREAAVNWLRGQISALRQEIAKGNEPGPGSGGN